MGKLYEVYGTAGGQAGGLKIPTHVVPDCKSGTAAIAAN